jgi:hypothetical protein
METQNTKGNSLYTYIQNNQKLSDLEVQINKVKIHLDNLENQISKCEEFGDEDAAEYLAERYNKHNLERIRLELKANAVRQEILLFELETALAE